MFQVHFYSISRAQLEQRRHAAVGNPVPGFDVVLLMTEQGFSIKKEMKVAPGLPASTGVLSSLRPKNLRMPRCLSE